MLIIKDVMQKNNIVQVHLRMNKTGILVTDLDDGRQFLYRGETCVDIAGVDYLKNPDCEVPNIIARVKIK